MRTIATSLFGLALLSAAPAPQTRVSDTSPAAPYQASPSIEPGEQVCRDRIHEVREANGKPLLQRDAEVTGEGLLIAAVDQRIDGCSVMVMHNDTSDIRPLPKASDRVQLLPAN